MAAAAWTSGTTSPFESVLKRVPNQSQPRYLLGLSYFLVQNWKDAATTLQPLWAEQNQNFSYLYVLGIAAGNAGQKQLEEQALGKLVEIGHDKPEFHLFMGKSHLNRQEYDDAIRELQLAAQGNPKLPFVPRSSAGSGWNTVPASGSAAQASETDCPASRPSAGNRSVTGNLCR